MVFVLLVVIIFPRIITGGTKLPLANMSGYDRSQLRVAHEICFRMYLTAGDCPNDVKRLRS